MEGYITLQGNKYKIFLPFCEKRIHRRRKLVFIDLSASQLFKNYKIISDGSIPVFRPSTDPEYEYLLKKSDITDIRYQNRERVKSLKIIRAKI